MSAIGLCIYSYSTISIHSLSRDTCSVFLLMCILDVVDIVSLFNKIVVSNHFVAEECIQTRLKYCFLLNQTRISNNQIDTKSNNAIKK